MKGVKFTELECWNHKAPKDFENHIPELFTDESKVTNYHKGVN